MAKKAAIYDSLFIVLLTTVCHFLFSKYGFNPTDEGFVLSSTNRVLHGQIPHVDFSSLRPLGYAYLHIPELLFSKNYVLLTSRFVFWLEQSLIAFLWIRFVLRSCKIEIFALPKYTLIVLCFIFNVHYFPSSVLHTIDGLLMCLIGLNIVIAEKKYAFIGFFFIGFAVLCKQNYLVILLITLILFNKKNIILNIITGVLPVALYVVFISIYNGCSNLMVQLSCHNELLKVGITPYIFSKLFFIGIIITILILFIKSRLLQYAYFYALIIIASYAMLTNTYHEKFSFLIFGASIGCFLFSIYKKQYRLSITFFIGTALAWCVSISVGYNSPALFLGAILTLMFICQSNVHGYTKLVNAYLLFILLQSSLIFYYVRNHNIYRDAAKPSLAYKLDGLVEGAYGIKTNINTFKVLVELDILKKKYPEAIVIPDFTACHIQKSHLSKIATEWPNKTEIPNQQILNFVLKNFVNDTSMILIPKYNLAKLSTGFEAVPKNKSGEFLILTYVYNHYKKTGESNYFEFYKK